MIVDSSILIVFGKINQLELLFELYDKILITKGIYSETVEQGIAINASDAKIIKKFIDENKIKIIKLDKENLEKTKKLRKLYSQLGRGESEAIILALERNEEILILDDAIARKIARLYNLKTIGTLRVILECFKKNKINEKQVRSIVKELIENQFRLSADVINEFWMIFNKLKKKKVLDKKVFNQILESEKNMKKGKMKEFKY